jgi:hypothetical protein
VRDRLTDTASTGTVRHDAERGPALVGAWSVSCGVGARLRVDATHTGTAEAMIGLTLGQLLIYLTSRETLEHYREGWDQGAREVRALPAVVRQRPVSEELGVVSAMFRATGLPSRTVALLDCVPPLVRIQLGPLFWQVLDQQSYAEIQRGWHQAATLAEHCLP